jgi:hypothetical protein
VTGAGSGKKREFAHAPEVIAAVVVVALSLIAFSPGLTGPYLWDDKALIPGNAAVRDMNVRAWFTRDFWDVGGDLLHFEKRLHYFRPLVTASYAIDFRIGGGEPFLLHLNNLVAHAIAAVLALFTLRRWTSTLLPACVGALFFALHPTKTESVAWISGRTDILCAIAILVASLGAARRLRGLRFGLALEIVGTVLAYLTKEGAVVLPAFVAIEAWIQLGRPTITRSTIRRVLLTASPQLALAVGYLALRAVVLPIRPFKPAIAVPDHAIMFVESLGRYVTLAIAPVALSSQHGLMRTVDGRIVHDLRFAALGAVALVGLAALAIAVRKRAPFVTVAIAFFAVMLLPVSNLMLAGLSTLVAERFLYLPLLAIAWLVAEGVARLRAQRAALALVVVALAPLTLVRALDFSDEVRFWTREKQSHPESLEAHRTLMSRARDARRYSEAVAHALSGREQASIYYRHNGAELEFIHHYLELRALLTPDRRIELLTALNGFFRALGDPNATIAEVRAPDLAITVPLGSGTFAERARALRVRTKTVLAELASRLGHDDEARALADEARASCSSCVQVVNVSAIVAARRGDYAEAYRLLDGLPSGASSPPPLRKTIEQAELAKKQASMAGGPVALQLRAMELATLEAYGRAYEVLAPYRAQIEVAPGFAIGFAELAYRAGEEQIARDVLGNHVPSEKIDPMFETWARKMGWLP